MTSTGRRCAYVLHIYSAVNKKDLPEPPAESTAYTLLVSHRHGLKPFSIFDSENTRFNLVLFRVHFFLLVFVIDGIVIFNDSKQVLWLFQMFPFIGCKQLWTKIWRKSYSTKLRYNCLFKISTSKYIIYWNYIQWRLINALIIISKPCVHDISTSWNWNSRRTKKLNVEKNTTEYKSLQVLIISLVLPKEWHTFIIISVRIY